MVFENQITGLKWQVEDQEVINRLSKDENYKAIINKEEKIPKRKTAAKE